MMKRSTGILAVTICLGTLIAYGQPRVVKKEIQTGYVPVAGGKLQPDQSRVVTLYDREGKVLEESDQHLWPKAQKIVMHTERNYYGVNGRLDSTLTFLDGARSLKMETLFDSAGREIGIQEFTSDGNRSYKTVYVFDISGRKIRQEMYDRDGKLFNFKNFKYDNQGNLTDENGSEQGIPRYRWVITYDSHNRNTMRRDYSGDGKFIRKHLYLYNADGRVVKETVLDDQGKMAQVVKHNYEYY